DNAFAGHVVDAPFLLRPSSLAKLANPLKPSWGEPYREIAQRMRAAIADARDAARGREAVLVSHQLPIWIARLDAEGRRFAHDPRRRQCALGSITSLHFEDCAVAHVSYTEPALR
ncbi:MAG: histidine phosphatase family protein, partial [Bifidobacteriaceae bacterium]|nr:histidine phosphatase family protein [Bifidobacteriaceae bacterium]